MHDIYQDLSHGICAVDTGFVRSKFDAAYLVIERGRAAFIDAGTNNGVARMLASLKAHGLGRDAVDFVIATHVHLDHAGGIGLLMREVPRAKLVIHPCGAPHMIDPDKLMHGVRAVYGDEVAARDYGQLVPVPKERVIESHDQMIIELGGRPLRIIHTSGHARHHHCIWDESSRGWFTGDTFGISYPELATANGPYMLPATAPVHFDPEALHASIERLLEACPDKMYLTHYGSIAEPAKLAGQLLRQIDAMVEGARELKSSPKRHGALKRMLTRIYLDELRSHGSNLSDEAILQSIGGDIELNAQGLGVWLDRS